MSGLTIKIEKDENEFHAWCPQLPGCHTHGKTVNSASKYLKEAMSLYIEDLFEESKAKAKQKYLLNCTHEN